MKGVCNCGAVCFTVFEPMPSMYQCHCSLCQKQSGSGSNAATIVSLNKFKWSSDTGSIKKWKKESGFNSHFCQNCGSPVPNSIGFNYMWVPAGLLNGVNSKVVAHLCLSSKSEWDHPIEALRNYEGMPENLEEFIQFLHSEKST